MGDRDDDDVVLSGERGAVIENGVAGPGPLSAAVEPHHHRTAASSVAGVHTFSRRQSSPIGPLPVSASPISGIIGRNGCDARGPYSNASTMPVQLVA